MGVSPSLTIEEEDTPMKRNYYTLTKFRTCHTVYAVETLNAEGLPVGGTPVTAYTSKTEAERAAAWFMNYYKGYDFTEGWTCVVKEIRIDTTERA